MRISGLALIPLVLGLMPVYGIDRVTVGVVCELQERRYRENLQNPQIADIEQSCAERLAAELDTSLAFLQFVPGNQPENSLRVRLGKDDSAVRSVDFEVWVEGTAIAGIVDPVLWPFRTVDEWLEIPTAEDFPDEIQLRFTAALRQNADALVNRQLSRIIIADHADPRPDDESWRMPFTREELRTEDDSQFGIKANLKMSDNSEERYMYNVKLKGDFSDGAKVLHLGDDTHSLQKSLERLKEAEGVKVVYVVVKRYVRLELPDTTAPADLEIDEQGGAP